MLRGLDVGFSALPCLGFVFDATTALFPIALLVLEIAVPLRLDGVGVLLEERLFSSSRPGLAMFCLRL